MGMHELARRWLWVIPLWLEGEELWLLLLEPVDISLHGQRWSEHLERLKPKILINVEDDLGGERHWVTETTTLILMHILLIFFLPSNLAF